MIIGSHDSTAYQVNFNVRFSQTNNKWEWIRKVAKFCSPFARKVVKITKAQSLSIYDQLQKGARAIDLRVSYCATDDTLYSSHTYATLKISDVLGQIKAFSEQFPNEKIYILMKAEPNNFDTMRGREVRLMTSILSLQFNSNVVWYWQKIDTLLPGFLDLGSLRFDWYNVTTVNDFLTKLNGNTYNEQGSYLICALTPREDLSGAIEANLQEFASNLNLVLISRLREMPEGTRPWIVLFDFVEQVL